jgi:hypothetical protein
MGLFFRDPSLWKVIENGLGFYFQVSSQLIDANLIWFRHSSVVDFSFPWSVILSSAAPGSPEETSAESAGASGEAC